MYSQTAIYQYLWTDPTSGQELRVDPSFYANESMQGDRRIEYLFEYEERLNNLRRRIKRLNLPTFQLFVQQFTELTSAAVV